MYLDPIEKKPLFHFLPGSQTMSIGFLGCNFKCDFCQNYDLSCTKGPALEKALSGANYAQEVSPQKFVEIARESPAKSIAFTYNEPVISAEYNLEAMKIAKSLQGKELKCVYVSNGYASAEQIKALTKTHRTKAIAKKSSGGARLDAINIDLKSFNSEFYKSVCGARLEEVLKCIKAFHKAGAWVELTTLLIPGKNNSPEELKQIAHFISKLDKKIPWHLSAFHPMHRMSDLPPTTAEETISAIKIGKEEGLKFVYGGNIGARGVEDTSCPKCGSILITRSRYETAIVGLKTKKEKGKCYSCGEKIPGVF